MKRLILPTIMIGIVAGCSFLQKPQNLELHCSGCARWGSGYVVEPFEFLKSSQCFRIGAVGDGAIPPEDIALHRLMKQENASFALVELYSEGSPAGQLYALFGLRFTDKIKYEELISQMRNNTCKVCTQGGCIVSEEAVQDIVESIEAGNYDAEFQREPVSD